MKARGLTTDPGDGHDLVFTSDGRWAYMAADRSPAALLIFERDPSTGALTQLPGTAGCISSDGSSQDGAGTCQTDARLLDASGVTMSSDDRFLYVTGTGGSDAIHVCAQRQYGRAYRHECIYRRPPAGCSTGRVVGDTQFIALSPDGTQRRTGRPIRLRHLDLRPKPVPPACGPRSPARPAASPTTTRAPARAPSAGRPRAPSRC